MKLFLKFTALTAVLFSMVWGDSLIVKTSKGLVRGVIDTADNGKEVHAWYSVPYAKPPLKELRFRPPFEIDSWTDVKDTGRLPNACYQIVIEPTENFKETEKWNPNTEMSEDCLYLTIVVPKPRPTNASVMVWIYGGGFLGGSSALNQYDYKMLASEQNIIVAAMQYRVGSLGFLYMDPENAPGNAGLFDQAMALKWIYENIKYFGGNRDSITIFGESAGGVSVGMHLLSTFSRNYFSRAIMESGSPLDLWTQLSKEEAVQNSFALARNSDCPICDSSINETIINSTICPDNVPPEEQAHLVLECLQAQRPEDLIKSEMMIKPIKLFRPSFLPIPDGLFFQKNFTELMQYSAFKNTSILLGIVSEEMSVFLFGVLPSLFKREENVSITKEEFEEIVGKFNLNMNALVKSAVKYEYAPWSNLEDGELNRDAIVRMTSDQQFVCSLIKFGQYYVNAENDVYMYEFSHRSSQSAWPRWAGTVHSEEIGYVFGAPQSLAESNTYTEEEKQLSKSTMKSWANFARTGNPNLNEDGTYTEPEWPLYNTETHDYMQLDTKDGGPKKGLRARECALWNSFIPEIEEYVDKIQHCGE